MPSRRLLTSLIVTLTVGAAALPADAGAQAAQPRIIGGTDATSTQFPFQARLRIVRGSSLYLCGAVIRDSTHVVTAAHCVVSSGTVSAPSSVTVYYGSANQGTQRAASVYAVQPASQYVAGNSSYDAALVTLNAPLVGYGSSTVSAVPMATASETAAAVSAGQAATVSGWGLTESGSTSQTLRSTQVTLRPDSACVSTYGSTTYASSRFVCAGGTGTAQTNNPDSCNGDSGGPLTTTVGSTTKLIGLVSFGPAGACGQPNKPGAYTEVSSAAINAVLTGTTEAPPVTPAPAPAPVPATPLPAPVATPARAPSAGFGGLRCHKRRCTMKVNAASSARVTGKLTRRSRRCYFTGADRFCRTVYVAPKSVKAKRSGAAFVLSTRRLAPATYRLTAVASDAAGRRSQPVTKQFRVRR